MKRNTPDKCKCKDGILSMDDIKYLFSIVNSNVTEEDKAVQLFSSCNMDTLLSNYNIYKSLDLKQKELLVRLISIYQEYEKKGYSKLLEKTAYKITQHEFNIRIEKLKSVAHIIDSSDTDYHKAESIIPLFESAETFRKSYALLIRYGKKDSNLNSVRDILDNFNKYYEIIKKYEEEGIFKSVRYILSISNYLEGYKYAKFIIETFVTTNIGYKMNDFLDYFGIDRDTFDYCVNIIEELDSDLYARLDVKRAEYKKLHFINAKKAFIDLALGIKTGRLTDLTEFDILEFIKRVPFKSKGGNFYYAVEDFVKRNIPEEYLTIHNYLVKNEFQLFNPLDELNVKKLYNKKFAYNGREISNNEITLIVSYLEVNNLPITAKTYMIALRKYLNGEFNYITVIEQRNRMPKVKKKVLIPSI